MCIQALCVYRFWLFHLLSSALLTWLRRLLAGSDAVYDEVTAGPETIAKNLPCIQTAARPHQRPASSLSAPLCSGSCLSAASTAKRAALSSTDVWCQHGQYLRLCLLPGKSAGGGWGLEQQAGPEPQAGLSQQSEEFGLRFRVLRGIMAGWRGSSQEDEERAGFLLSMPPHKQSSKWTYSTQIHLWRLSRDVDIVWVQWPRGLDKLFTDQRTQPPASGSGWQQLCRPHTELDGFARLSCWTHWTEAECSTQAGERLPH